MEEIAKEMKVAGAIGRADIKAVKTIHDTLQTDEEPQGSQAGSPSGHPTKSSTPASQSSPAPGTPAQPAQSSPQYSQGVIYCDQCGAPSRSGKRFCNRCGAPLT